MLKGVDISNWQGGLTPSALDIDFCIAKATEGTYFVDAFCDGFIQDCIANNILWGFYHFAHYDDPEKEAQFFYDNCIGYIKKGIPALDYEVWGANDDVAWCEKFLKKFHDLSGVWPLLYISASHCGDFYRSWIPEKCGLWVAGYPGDCSKFTTEDMPYDISPWAFAAIWQFTSGLILPGYAKPLDGDIAYMNKAAWGKYAGFSTKDEKVVENKDKEKKVLTGRVTIELD